MSRSLKTCAVAVLAVQGVKLSLGPPSGGQRTRMRQDFDDAFVPLLREGLAQFIPAAGAKCSDFGDGDKLVYLQEACGRGVDPRTLTRVITPDQVEAFVNQVPEAVFAEIMRQGQNMANDGSGRFDAMAIVQEVTEKKAVKTLRKNCCPRETLIGANRSQAQQDARGNVPAQAVTGATTSQPQQAARGNVPAQAVTVATTSQPQNAPPAAVTGATTSQAPSSGCC
ncbi:unnamed protein product [Amoebophrya sp. A25]|nr:unnamed protein product [Amoebophrya sp. A25]|eukprot:GSA25T00002611001.1